MTDPTPAHEHYWVDAADDETGWYCTTCGVTEYPVPEWCAEPECILAFHDDELHSTR